MSDKNTTDKPINFIRHQINDDLDSGLHSAIQTRFPPESLMVICIVAMRNLFA